MSVSQNPFQPPGTLKEGDSTKLSEAGPKSSGPKSHWAIRWTIGLVGLVTVGMVLALLLSGAALRIHWLGWIIVLSTGLVGLRLIDAGLRDRPTSLRMLQPRHSPPRSKRRF